MNKLPEMMSQGERSSKRMWRLREAPLQSPLHSLPTLLHEYLYVQAAKLQAKPSNMPNNAPIRSRSMDNDSNARPFPWRGAWMVLFAVFCAVQLCNSWRTTSAILDQRAISRVEDDEQVAPTSSSQMTEEEMNRSLLGKQHPNGTQSKNERWQKADWFDIASWSANAELAKSCHHVEHVCFQQQNWFYDTTMHHVATEQHGLAPIPNPHQPKSKIHFENNLSRNSFNPYQRNFEIKPSMPLTPASNATLQQAMRRCNYSPVPNHMILQGSFTSMLGEFYVRVFFPTLMLLKAIADVTMPQTDASADGATAAAEDKLFAFLETFRWQTQLYLGLGLGEDSNRMKLLESHRLLLESFSSNPIAPLSILFDNTKCQCVQRMFFCGFRKDDKDKDLLEEDGGVGTVKLVGKQRNVPLRLEIARRFLRKAFVEDDPFVKDAVEAKRRQYLISKGVKEKDIKNTKDYKIIGLAQRNTRRRWLRLRSSENYCNLVFKDAKVRCVEVNLEDGSMASPVKHLVAHAALDGLIGIHGAQLTEALFMPPGSLVVEFLPWVLEGLMQGRWTNIAHHPTPVGEMFFESDLNHIVYPLREYSSRHLNCTGTGLRLLQCYRKPANRWDERSFALNQDVVVGIISKFVNPVPKSCEEYQHHAGDEYVLINVNCADGSPSATSQQPPQLLVHHFYKDKDWVDNKVNSSKSRYAEATIQNW